MQLHYRSFGPAVAFGQDEADLGKHRPMSDRVRRLAVLLLPRGHCRAEVVARHLGVDRRTVANHLAAEHTTLSALIDAMRRELLQRHVAQGSRSLSEVSVLLRFSELRSLSRWHRRHRRQFSRAARQRAVSPPH